MSHLALFVSGLPGLRVSALGREHAAPLCDLVRDMELEFFGRSETNVPEVLGTLQAPELLGGRGTAGVWDGDELLGALLAYDALKHERGLFLDLFVGPTRRAEITDRLVQAARGYADTLDVRPDSWLKVESFAGDDTIAAVLADDGFRQHRVYLRMRLDFTSAPAPGVVPAGLTTTGMTEDLWPDIHTVLTDAFRDHYDSHPLPLDLFRRSFDRESTDLRLWRLVYDHENLVGVRISSTRYAPHGLGYVESLGVLQSHRGRGIASYLLHDAFAMDYAAGLAGCALHCDATNPTGATHLYEAVGMRRDQRYDAWRARF